MMECLKTQNSKHCTCSYSGCPHSGICCACMSRHLKKKQLPACFFSAEAERRYDRSFTAFAEDVLGK